MDNFNATVNILKETQTAAASNPTCSGEADLTIEKPEHVNGGHNKNTAVHSIPHPVHESKMEPHIDQSTGEWVLSEFDVECMAIGAGILGCGGGGNPYIGKLRTQQLIKSGKKIRVIHPDR